MVYLLFVDFDCLLLVDFVSQLFIDYVSIKFKSTEAETIEPVLKKLLKRLIEPPPTDLTFNVGFLRFVLGFIRLEKWLTTLKPAGPGNNAIN